ncbi:MAG: hypothetical protein AB1571_00640 [Nanoarchaeota archaeon]
MGLIELRGPIWFYKLDTIIQFFGALVALLISYYTYKAYKLSSKKAHLYFSIAFALLGLNLIIYSIVLPAWMVVYAGSGFIVDIFSLPVLLLGSKILNILYVFSYLMAYSLLIFVYSKIERKSMIALTALFTLVISIYSSIIYSSYSTQIFMAFNIISLMLLSIIVFFTYKNYMQKKNRSSFLVLSAFLLIAVSHLLMLFESFNNAFFLSAHVAQLLGYISLLIVTRA